MKRRLSVLLAATTLSITVVVGPASALPAGNNGNHYGHDKGDNGKHIGAGEGGGKAYNSERRGLR